MCLLSSIRFFLRIGFIRFRDRSPALLQIPIFPLFFWNFMWIFTSGITFFTSWSNFLLLEVLFSAVHNIRNYPIIRYFFKPLSENSLFGPESSPVEAGPIKEKSTNSKFSPIFWNFICSWANKTFYLFIGFSSEHLLLTSRFIVVICHTSCTHY